MPKHLVSRNSRLGVLSLIMALLCLTGIQPTYGQTAITTINTNTASATSSTTQVTAPSDASNAVTPSKVYNINYGQGNDVFLTDYVIGATTYDNFLNPDTLVIRRTDGSTFINIWYSLNAAINNGPTIGEIDLIPTAVTDADAIYQSGLLNAGYDNILVNDDDLAGASIQAQTERVDVIWYSGIVTSSPSTAVFPILERGGNDNIAIAPITALDANGDPSTYGTLVGIASSDWTGGTVSVGTQLILRRQTIGQDPIPILDNASQSVEGVAVSFQDLGISADQIVYGFSIFASDVEGVGGAPAIAAGVDLTDISTFPNTTLSSVSGLDLVAGLAAAVASDDELIESVGPGGYKSALSTWLKANDGAFVTSGGAASTEGTNVGFWEDQAVGNHDFTTSTAAPTFRSTTSDINFNPTVDFIENVERGLTLANNEDFNDKVTNNGFQRKSIHVAFRTNANDITTKQQIYEQGGGTNGLGIYVRNGSVHVAAWNRGNTSNPTAPWNEGTPTPFISASVALDTEYIITFELDGDNTGLTGTMTAYLNGQSMGSISNVGLLFDHTGGIEFGDSDGSRYDDNTTAATSFEGEISEFIYCNEPASFPVAIRQGIESYLAIKYGITLDQSSAYNYVNSNGDIIFNTTNAASIGGYLEYNNDIAGIGRDDDSELIQLKSKSENANSVVTVERATSIGTDDTWLIWGNDGASVLETDALTMPSTIDMRITRVWRVAEENEIGQTSVSFDLSELGSGGLSTSDAGVYSLLVASNSSNANFGSATVITGGIINGSTITFSGVDLEDGQYFTLGTKFFFCTPGDYDDGIAMWLRADVGVTTATEGATVTSWLDQTPSGNNGTNLTAPIYRATTELMNDNPTIDFSTGSTGINIPDSGPFNVNQSLSKKFSVTFRTDDDITTKQVIFEEGGATRGINLYIQSGVLHLSAWNQAAGDGVGAPWNTGTISTVNTSSIAINTTYIVTFDYAGNDAITGTLTGYLNGNSFGTPLSNIGRLYGHTDDIGLGDEAGASRYADGTTSGAASFDGFIPEMTYYNEPTVYGATERNRVETSMAIKYGVTLDQTSATNYTSSDGTAIWNATTNATYNNDIAGIGQDDGACLNQKQSQSQNTGSIVKMGLGSIAATNAANANTFSDDGDFLIWGNDGDFANQANANTSDLPASVTERMERIWRVDDTGEVGATEISFDLTGLGYGTNLTDFQLIISDSPTMASGTTSPAASYDLGTNTVTFSGINLTDGQYFTLATARELCAPGGVSSGLLLSLKGDVGTTGTGVVTAWADQSLNAFSATATNGPELISNGINFNPSLQFNGTNETMAITNGILGTSSPNDLVVFAVTEVNTVQDSWLFYEPLASSGRFSSHIPWGDGNAYYDYPNSTNGNGRVQGAWGGTTGNANLWALFSSTTSFSTPSGNINKGIFRDGSLIASNTSSVTGTGNNSNFNIGSNGSANFYDADVAEILIYNNAPTTQELEQIQTYFAIKYGVFKNSADNGTTGGVDERDYFASDASVIWDYSANTAYHNDVAGIGRDDESCLNQKQSSSEGTDDILTIGLGSVAADNASNANSFDDNGDFLVWGNDNGTTAQATANTSDLPSSVSERMSRVWKVEDTGTVGNTELQFDLTGLGYSSSAAAFRLIVSNTSTMADGTLIAGGTFNGSVLSFSGIDLTDGQFFTLATALETCGPGGVNTGISLWLRADQQVFSDAGSTAAVDGVDVQQWNDQGPGAIIASEVDQGGGTPVEPTFETSEINFNPVLRFIDANSGNNSYIETATISEPGDDFTLISVFQSGQDQGTLNDFVNTPALIGGSETSSTLDYGLGLYQGQVIINANTSVVFDASTTGTSYNDNTPHMALATRTQSNGAVSIYMEGLLDGSGTGSTSTLNGATTLGIGNHSDADVQAQFGGDIAESIVFSKVLTGEEQSRVESYLALKYGLTVSNNRDGDGSVNENISGSIDEGDYVAGDGGIVWDYANNSTYHNDIFGIARDDVSCFDQTQSKSENSDAMVTFNYTSGFDNNDSWLISGNDNAAIEAINNNERPATIKSRLNREWKVQETGTVGSIELTYDLTSITGTPLGDNNLNLVRLMVDDDGDFSNGGTTLIEPASIDGGAKTVTFNVDFTDGQFYTLGSTEIDALPITLIAFDTRATTDNKVEVTWATAEEINNSFFTIERSRDALNFETVGFTEGAGNSIAIIDYTFIDQNPLDGVSYYRLKQTDFNGEFDYSEVSRISLNLEQSSVHQVVPNPVEQGQTFTIEYPVSVAQDVSVSITSASGINTLNTRFNVTPEVGKIKVSTHNMSKGLYFIRIIDRNLNSITKKVIIK